MIIAQISDIHAAADNDNFSRFNRALRWLDQLSPDVLVITGDLIEHPSHPGYQPFADLLQQRRWPVFIVPGNADNREAMFATWGDSLWPARQSAEPLHFVADLGTIRLIGIDTTLEGEAAGGITPHLAWLEQQLPTDETICSILFLHHHLFESGIPALDRIMCRDYAALERLLRHHPFPPQAIAMGHVHRSMASCFAGIPAYICGSICPANPLWFGTQSPPTVLEPPQLMIHRFSQGKWVGHIVAI